MNFPRRRQPQLTVATVAPSEHRTTEPVLRELIHRYGTVTRWEASVWKYVINGAKHVSPLIELHGDLDETVKSVKTFCLRVRREEGAGEYRSIVGVIISAKPDLDMAVNLEPTAFGLVQTMITVGRMPFISVSMESPRYGRAYITSIP